MESNHESNTRRNDRTLLSDSLEENDQQDKPPSIAQHENRRWSADPMEFGISVSST